MNIDNLLKMANQIGQFFESQPDREQALMDISTHLTNFWAPAMRRELIAHLEKSSESGLSNIVEQSLLIHKHRLIE